MVKADSPDYVLKVDTAALRESAARMRALARNLDDEGTHLGAVSLALRRTWVGLPADAYASSFSRWLGDLQRQAIAARIVADGLDEIADGFVEASKRVVAIWSGAVGGGL